MKQKTLKIFFYLVLIVGGWTLSYLRIPYVNHTKSFWVGFAFCVCLIILSILGIRIWKKNSQILGALLGESTVTEPVNFRKNYTSIWVAVALFILAGGITSVIMVVWQSNLITRNTDNQNKRILELTEITESIRKNNQINLLSNVLNQVEAEIKIKPQGPLSDAIIARVAALSYSFKPYRYLVGDSLSERELSPERGQLLMALTLMNIDSTSFTKIKQKTTFAYADLRRITLSDVDLSGVNLEAADLSYSDFTNVNINHGNLKHVMMESVVLLNTIMSNSDLNCSHIQNSIISNCIIIDANLNGTFIKSSNFSTSNFSGTTFDVGTINNSTFNNTIMLKTDFARCNLNDVVLNIIDLRGGRLIKSNLTGLLLKNVKLNGVEVQENWLDVLDKNKVDNYRFLLDTYHITDSISNGNVCKYVLMQNF